MSPTPFDPFTDTPDTLRQAVECMNAIDLLEGRTLPDGSTLQALVSAGKVPAHLTARGPRRKLATEIAKRMGPNLRLLNRFRGRVPSVAEKIAARKARKEKQRARKERSK